MIDDQLNELAQINVREAMKKEFELNERIIEEYKHLNRYSKRYLKERTIRAIVRNDSIRGFLSLDTKDQIPKKLKRDFTSSDSTFNHYVNQVKSRSYANTVKWRAIEEFYRDYTKPGNTYSSKRYLLDESIPRHSRLKGFSFLIVGDTIDFVIGKFGTFVVLALVVVFVYASFFYDSEVHLTQSSNSYDTFHEGGVFGGNSSEKPVKDIPQIKDQSGQAGFGNGGVSGFDSSSSGGDSSLSIQGVVETETGTETEVIKIEWNCQAKNCVTLGSMKEDVFNVMGEQKKERKSSNGDAHWWHYGDDEASFIQFNSQDKVIGWKNVDNTLKVSLGIKDYIAKPFKVGSNKELVIKAMGTPDEIYNENYWRYGASEVFFLSNGEVSSFINKDENLLVE
ncbi:hypothetical protein PAT3040_02668 [Paenibacillus agaridevorans]|uniref:Uncharacterized protein n=1 Tax=Paenibacillus agaridevorans TaxID=171404 RepID=A0A2R5EXM5_9BACL|nr:hypothetical protein [Paenibacillus agaridevorans]GBG08101.1 hypothetical protein PAT3040_02668 [Paenibacillus agaridevorans]